MEIKRYVCFCHNKLNPDGNQIFPALILHKNFNTKGADNIASVCDSRHTLQR